MWEQQNECKKYTHFDKSEQKCNLRDKKEYQEKIFYENLFDFDEI